MEYGKALVDWIQEVDLVLILFFDLRSLGCPRSLECIHICISFGSLNDHVDVALGNDEAHEGNQKPIRGRKQQAEIDETHSLSTGRGKS